MYKIRITACLILLLTLLSGCKPPPPTPLPLPDAPEEGLGIVPDLPLAAAVRYQVGTRSEFSLWDTAVTERLPLAGREILVEPVDELTFRQDLTGIARMALAHPVSNAFEPNAFDPAQDVTWVLFLPAGEDPNVRAWQDIVIETSPDGAEQVLIIEREISQVISFTPDATSPQASLQALLSERNDQSDPARGGPLWIDALLMEETDEQGSKTWKLYASGRPPGAPTGGEKHETFCCQWLGCGGATGRWAKICYYWDCLTICRD
jgi:hypothetical protein